MTENEWLSSEGPASMIDFVLHSPPWVLPDISARKIRLFACACCRRIAPLMPHARCRELIDAIERYVDGGMTERQLTYFAFAVELGVNGSPRSQPADYAAGAVIEAANFCGPFDRSATRRMDVVVAAERALAAAKCAALAADVDRGGVGGQLERAYQARILRDILGNPFQAVEGVQSLQTETAVALAKAIYDERAFDRMPELALALEKAGCRHPALLSHCRDTGEHARGCWVVDTVLGLT